MITGRKLIIYILKNNLEDEPVFENGKFIGCITEMEAAIKLGVGPASIMGMQKMGSLDGVQVKEGNYIFDDSVNKLLESGLV